MSQSKHEFFEKGIVNQKRPSIVVDIKMADLSKMAKWKPEEKQQAKQFLSKAKKRLQEMIFEAENVLSNKKQKRVIPDVDGGL